jgi:hypothetical protein
MGKKTPSLDTHHRALIFWKLHGAEGVANDAEVQEWTDNLVDHGLQNLSDEKAEQERAE